jgi:ribosome biogenesis GTPase
MLIEDLRLRWGFHPAQVAYLVQKLEEDPDLIPARVVFSSHDSYRILILGQIDPVGAKVRGHFYHDQTELPVVGDWVLVDQSDGGDHDSIPIEAVMPRKSSLQRPDTSRGRQVLIANVDHIGLVTSFNQDLNERRIERALVMIRAGGAQAFIVINKSDLARPLEVIQHMKTLESRFSNIPINAVSASGGQGVHEILSKFSRGETVAFIGMSGVGKSTLVNRLLNEEVLKTKEIRSSDARGRHTTTHRELFSTAQGVWIIDNPGIREFSPVASEVLLTDGLEGGTFSEIVELSRQCRYRDCTHVNEPDCKINNALLRGELNRDSWLNYQKLKRESSFQERKEQKRHRSLTRKPYIRERKDRWED